MNKNFGHMDDYYQDDYEMGYQDGRNFSNEYVSYPQPNRYNNAYGNYRGGYDRSNQGPPLGFGPNAPMGPHGFYGPPRPPGPPYAMPGEMRWRRGYPVNPPRVSRKERITKYLLRCGIAREHIINVPHDVLMMMQPMNCGLCVQKFETNELSKIHYASKNHLKNQKKWVTQQTNNGSQGKEPLKARDLYCELCDVHITSAGHAESHYAGKPHRAIVDGRKNARNPFLLQPNKQARLKALIRRELKYIKKLEASSDGKSKPQHKPGELYCHICKTSMMCSEQMTIHLNGKRHLSKEKQHILRLMKGEESGDAKNDSPKEKAGGDADQGEDMEGDEYEDEEKEEDEEDEEENEENGDGKDDGAEKAASVDDDDWGEGGEDWKPSAEDY